MELIVVLVLLAILAAVIVPALLGYIDEARAKQYLLNAKNCINASQAMLVELYAENGDQPVGTPVVSGARKQSTSGNEDQDVTNTDFAERVLKLADLTGDDAPYCFMIAVGSNAAVKGSYTVTEHDKYTVYYAFYMETEDAFPWYYYNGSWTSTNPRATGTKEVFDSNNIVKSGELKGKRLQYYLISNKTSYTNSIADGNFWTWLKSMR